MLRTVAALVGIAAAVVAVVVVRELTISRHVTHPASSSTDVVLTATTRGAEHSLAENVHALVLLCRLEVDAELVEGPASVGGDRFAFTVSPALDASDKRQLQGCIEDAVIDHLQAGVRAMTDRGRQADG